MMSKIYGVPREQIQGLKPVSTGVAVEGGIKLNLSEECIKGEKI